MDPSNGRVVIVSSGLSPLMNGFSKHGETLNNNAGDNDWDTIAELMNQCLEVERQNGGPADFEAIGFSGGKFCGSHHRIVRLQIILFVLYVASKDGAESHTSL